MKMKKSLLFCLTGLTLLILGACGSQTASEADCQKFADHVIELGLKDVPEGPAADMAKKMAQDNMGAIVKKCAEEKIDKKALDCSMKAQSLEEVAKCGAPTK